MDHRTLLDPEAVGTLTALLLDVFEQARDYGRRSGAALKALRGDEARAGMFEEGIIYSLSGRAQAGFKWYYADLISKQVPILAVGTAPGACMARVVEEVVSIIGDVGEAEMLGEWEQASFLMGLEYPFEFADARSWVRERVDVLLRDLDLL